MNHETQNGYFLNCFATSYDSCNFLIACFKLARYAKGIVGIVINYFPSILLQFGDIRSSL